MSLGLSHSLSRYKLKFSPDKVCADYKLGPGREAQSPEWSEVGEA